MGREKLVGAQRPARGGAPSPGPRPPCPQGVPQDPGGPPAARPHPTAAPRHTHAGQSPRGPGPSRGPNTESSCPLPQEQDRSWSTPVSGRVLGVRKAVPAAAGLSPTGLKSLPETFPPRRARAGLAEGGRAPSGWWTSQTDTRREGGGEAGGWRPHRPLRLSRGEPGPRPASSSKTKPGGQETAPHPA